MKLLLVFLGLVNLASAKGAEDISDKASSFYGDPVIYNGKMTLSPSFQILNEGQYKQFLLFSVESILGDHCSESTIKNLQFYLNGLETGEIAQNYGTKAIVYTSKKQVEFCESVKGHPTVPDKNKKKIIKAYKEYKCNLNVDPEATPVVLREDVLGEYLKNCRSMTRSLTFREIFEYNELKEDYGNAPFVGSLYDQALGTLPPAGGGFNGGYGNGGYNLGQITYSKELEGITSSDDRTISEEIESYGNDNLDDQNGSGALENP